MMWPRRKDRDRLDNARAELKRAKDREPRIDRLAKSNEHGVRSNSLAERFRLALGGRP